MADASPMNGLSPRQSGFMTPQQTSGNNLADVLERVLDKGIVIVGDIQVRLLDIELLTIKIRLMVASVERAQEMGINWWESDPFVSSVNGKDAGGKGELDLEQRVLALEQSRGNDRAGT